jgi:nickel-dependent lactate racemase
MERPFIKYGNEKRFFQLPPDWKLLTFALFHEHHDRIDVEQLTRNRLNKPIGRASLRESVTPDDRIAVLVEDQTRCSPKGIILKALLEELDDFRIPRDHISIILSLGTHRNLSHQEMGEVYGKGLVEEYSFFNHDCHASDLVTVGRLKTGTPVKINRLVYEATFKIGIGSIFPHPMNGFGGGGKILFPGVSNFEAILEHHLKYSFRGGSELGALVGNPFYEEIRHLTRAAGLDFIVNSVLDHNDRLYDLVCGDPVEAHLAGIEICKGIISQKFQEKADLTIISSFPYTEGMQLMKPLAPASMITKEGGVIILVAHCTFPFPDIYVEGCEKFRMKYGDRLRENILDFFDNNRRIIEGGAPEFNMSMAQALLAQDDYKVIFVSEDIPRDVIERIGFLLARDLVQAFALSKTYVSEPGVHIIPSGGVILPVLEGRGNQPTGGV